MTVTDEQLAELEALAETARAEGWQFVTPALRDAVPSLIAEVKRLRAVVADRAAVVEECARVADQARAHATGSREAQASLNIATRIRALAFTDALIAAVNDKASDEAIAELLMGEKEAKQIAALKERRPELHAKLNDAIADKRRALAGATL